MSAVWDMVIVGGGLSGLALAAQLSEPVFAKLRVLVLEARTDYVRDRTWSYWRPGAEPAHAYAHLERTCWNAWRVGLGTRLATHRSNTISYCTLDADAFYQEALHKVRACQHIELRFAVAVDQVQEGALPTVRTSAGEIITAAWVCDTRPATSFNYDGLVQQFAGWEVHTQHDAFDASTVELMRFEPSALGLHFLYVLPYSTRNALIETTWVCPASHKPDYEAELQQYLQNTLGSHPFEVTYREKGVLPLQTKPQLRGQRVLPIGSSAGALRPSTGYAFIDILQHTQRIAQSLAQTIQNSPLQSWQPPQFVRSVPDDWMDRVFLDVLQSDWSRAPEYFLQMFENVDAVTLVAFLTGKATLLQRIAVAQALPKSPFIAAALRQIRKP